jgi:hypothetical protein
VKALEAMTPLILKRASASRSSGQWSDNDYDVLEDGKVVGRIFWRRLRRRAARGCGRAATTAISAARRMAMRPRERPQWQRSLRAGGGRKPRPSEAVTAPLPMPASSLESCGHGATLALEHVVGKSVFIIAGGPLWKKSPCEQFYTDADAGSDQPHRYRAPP